MRVARGWLLKCSMSSLIGVFLWCSGAQAAAVVSSAGASRTPLVRPLMIPGAEPFFGGQAARAQWAQWASPEAVIAREQSLTRFAHMSTAQAAVVARSKFGSLVNSSAGGTPQLPAGARLVGFAGANVARVLLRGGKHAVVESAAPMAKPTAHGRFAPLDLRPRRVRGGFVPVSSGTAVWLPARIGAGVVAPGAGVSLTPVDAAGAAVGGAEGSIAGASVFYANAETGTDAVAKPTSGGFELAAILRSMGVRRLYYRVGMPAGARLAWDRRGPVRIVKGKRVLALLLPPSARDAAGMQVPLATTVRGDVIGIEVLGNWSDYELPIAVDPELVTTEDRSLTGAVFPVDPYKGGTNWLEFHSGAFGEKTYTKHYSCGTEWYWCEQSWYIEPVAAYNASEFVGLQYETQGESKVYKLEAWLEGENEPSQTTSYIEFDGHHGEGQTNYATLSSGLHQTRYKFEPALVCSNGAGCQPSEPPNGNVARIMDSTTKAESVYGFWMWIWAARAWVAQEKGPEASYNTTSATIAGAENRPNVLLGSGSWLSPSHGAYEIKTHDPGIGVSFAAVSGAGMSDEKFIRTEEGACKGIQCSETYNKALTYLPSMANGEDSIEAFAEDAAGLYGYTYQTIKVDAAKPYNVKVKGMAEEGAEISAAPHTLTFEATDGTKPTPSSGIKSITVSIDGGAPAEVPGVYCSPGECTGKGEWTLHAEGLSEGEHEMTITATDNAGNSQPRRVFFDVRHATPVALGPGSVDPTTGQFSLNATDVSLSGVSGVSRTYQSRNLTAGAEGPLGPQWAINIGAGEGLSVLSTGDVELQASGGAVTTFHRNEKGEYESPQGDSNLKVETKEKEAGKGITEYIVKDASGGTATHYTQPTGERPSFSTQFGDEVAGELKEPVSEALDASGNLWVTDFANSRIEKFSPTGLLQAAYGSYGSEGGQFEHPWGIAVNQSNGDVYVSDQGNYRVEEFSSSGTFIRSFGEKGTGSGQFGILAGVAVDSSGNVWVADYGNNRIEEFKETGEFEKAFGSEGTGNGQFKGPTNIAFSGGHMYVTDYGNSRVEKFSMSGTYESQFGKSGSGNGEFKGAYGIATEPATGNLYVVDNGNKRVEEFSAAGSFITKFGASGSGSGQFSGPDGVAVSTAGNIYVADAGGSRVEEWARLRWLPTIGEGPLPSASTTYTYQTAEVGEEVVLEPAEALAPAPPGVSCAPKLEKGCRALTFNYASSTTASGESESQWGDYKGNLSRVYFTAWDPSKGEMTETIVAQYAYDNKGHLRAEWDPRISPALKTVYGYDAEGHITAVTRAGQETVALIYGTIAGDSNTGRLLKETQAPASAPLWNGEAPVKTETPKLSGTPAVGVRMSVSNGTWSNSPVAYGYQWEDCNSKGEKCTPILGATNANYTPTSSDVGDTLVALVTATNGGGSVTAASAASVVVTPVAGAYTQAVDGTRRIAAISCIPSTTTCVISDSAGQARYATTVSSSGAATWKEWSGPSGQSPSQALDCPSTSLCMLADGKEEPGGKLYYATSLGGAFGEAYGPTYGVDAVSCPSSSFCVAGQHAEGYFRYSTKPASTSWTLEDQGSAGMTSVFCLSTSFCAMADNKGNVHIATSTAQIESSSWKVTDVDGSTGLNGVACTSTSACVAVDGAGDELTLAIESSGAATASRHDIDGSTSLTGVTCTGSTTCVAVDKAGNVFISKNSGETWTKQYAFGDDLTSVSCVSSSLCAAADTTGSVTAFNLTGEAAEGEMHAPQPGTTVEYHVPVSGTGAPHNLSESEASKWGQKDLPVEGMAIFPPDEPQGWPASDYKRATIQYLDAEGRTVNAAAPTGGIATTEYNELNEPDRTLSADNRATALKENCESREHCKSAETAAKLDSESTYSRGGQLVETLGPEHKVKLAAGSEVLARNHMVYHYDEGAPEGEEYSLVTKTTDGAEYEGKEADVRTTLTSYSGQKDLGWTLRKPTSVTTDPTGLDLTTTTEYNETTGNVVATKSPAGSSQTVTPLSYSGAFGSEGSEGGQFKEPGPVAIDAGGDVWVVDTENARIEKFSSSGAFIAAYGSKGSGDGQFSQPWGIAVNQSTGSVFVSDTENNRIEKFSSSGTFEMAIGWGVKDGKAELETCTNECKAGIAGSGDGQFHEPTGLAINTKGDIWVVDEANDRVEEFSPTGEYLSKFGSEGSGNGQLNAPDAIAISEGELYVVDNGNNRVEEFSPGGTYLAQFGGEGTGAGEFKRPSGIAVNPNNGDLYISDTYNNRIQEFTPAGKYLTEFGSYGSGKAHFHSPTGLAMTGAGDLYVVDTHNARVQEWLPPEPGGAHLTYSTQFGSAGSGEGEFNSPRESALDGHGDLWVTDYNNHRVEEFSPTGKFIAAYGSWGTGEGHFEDPTGIDINQSTGDVYIADCALDRIQELSSTGAFIRSFGSEGSEPGQLKCPGGLKLDSGGNVWVTDSGNDRIEEFSSTGTFKAAYGSEGSGNGQFREPWGLTFSGGNLYIVDYLNDRIEEMSTSGAYLGQIGFEGNGGGQFHGPETITTDAAGHLYVTDTANSRVEEFSTSGAFLASFGTAGSGDGQLNDPEGIAINAAGDMYVSDARNNRIEVWAPNSQAVHDIKTIYYTAKEEAEVSSCRNHPEWVGLPCETTPAAQPESGLPELPVKTYTYNIWDEVETTTETVTGKSGSTTRTVKETYDAAGRALTSETSSTVDTALPKVTNEYSSATGALIGQSATIKGATKTIGSKYNTLGQLVEYTDAEGSTTKYSYDVDGRPTEVSYELPGKATDSQVYSYDPTSGLMTELRDTVPGTSMTFTAAYDVEGKLTSEGYPNGMSAGYTISPTGQATSVEYVKLTHCSEKCTWFSDSIAPSIHGETLAQSSTLASESYGYDAAGRLTQTQETPAGKGCTTRLYAYNEDSDRTSLTTVAPGSEGQCESEGGSVERHVYDPADRLADEGVVYETFGNVTTMPAADAGGHELTSSYYVDGQVASEKQNGETLSYLYDPAGRTLETVAEGTSAVTTIDHYAGPGEGVSWVGEGGEAWTRNVPGIDGALAAVQKSGQAPVLQLHDLQGNVVATAALSETETKLLSTYNSTEFGVPQPGTTPPKYAWLGAGGLASEPAFGSGVTFKGGATYVPQVARNLQSYPIIPPGAFPNGLGPATPYTAEISSAAFASAEAQAQKNYAETEAARQAAKRKEEEEFLAWCRSEGGCGAESPRGSREAIGGSGNEEENGDATAARSPNCEVQWELDEVPDAGSGLMHALGEFTCKHAPEHFELQLCGYVSPLGQAAENAAKQFFCAVTPGHNYLAYSKAQSGGADVSFTCGAGYIYTAWVWGFEYGKGYSRAYPNSSIFGEHHKWQICEGPSAETEVSSYSSWF